MTELTSGRKRRQITQAGVEALKRRPGWDPAKRERPEERATAALVEDRAATVYAQVTDCLDCAQARRELSDATALCDAHFAAAVG